MNMERCLSMAVVRGISYNEFIYSWPSWISSSRVYIFKFLTCDIKGMRHSVDCGNRHPFITALSDRVILAVLLLYTFTYFSSSTVM